MNNSLIRTGKIVLSKLKPRGRFGLFSVFFLAFGFLTVLFIAGVRPAQADIDILGMGTALSTFVGNMFLGIAAKAMGATVFVLRFVIELASYNNYINAPAVTLGWVLVRDVTNMFFVAILMLIAFGTVLGLEQYEWKKMLMKFVLAAILVNFSRVICGIIIDAAQVFMMTFISGVAATAGGNLVNLFELNNILAFSNTATPTALSDTMNIVISGILSCIFAVTALLVIGAYLFMLVARVIALWVTIVLSPLAFVLGVIPKFQSYASQWWSEFTNNVLSGPILAFFLWLAFAIAGGANIHDEFSVEKGTVAYSVGDYSDEANALAAAAGDESGTNANMIMEWENLANFILAVAFMLAGVKVTQKLSAAGAGMLGTAAGAATKFAYAASGAAAGLAAAKWGARTAWSGTKAVGKAAVMNIPLVGGKSWQRRGKKFVAGAKATKDNVLSAYEQGKFGEGLAKFGKVGKGAQIVGSTFFGQKAVKSAEKALADEKAGPLRKFGAVVQTITGRMTLTPAQLDKEVKFAEGRAKSAEEARGERLGMGSTNIGKQAGRAAMDAEIAKEDADKDKRIALGRVKADLLDQMANDAEGAGRITEAANRRQAAVAERARVDYFEDSERKKKLENVDHHGLVFMATQEADKTKNLADRFTAAVNAGDKRQIEKTGDLLKEQIKTNIQLQAIASRDHETRSEVDEILIKKSGYTGGLGTADTVKMEIAKIAGIDTGVIDNTPKVEAEVEKIMKSLESDRSFQASAGDLKRAESDLFSKTGNVRYGSALTQGVVTDKQSGQKKVVYGFGENVGEYDTKGVARTPSSPRQVFETSRNSIDYLVTSNPNFTLNKDVSIIFNQSTDASKGKLEKASVDNDQLKAINKYLKGLSMQKIKNAFSPKFVDDLNELLQNNRLDSDAIATIRDEMIAGLDNSQIAVLKNKFPGLF